MIDADLTPAPQPWLSRRVVTFAGQFDTKIETGEDYDTLALADLWTYTPTRAPKGAGPAIVPSTYADYNAREHAAQREHGRFVLLCGDVDSGDHQLEAIKKAVAAFAPRTAALIYSSAHARPGDMRWRILIPLADEQPFDTWHDAQTAFFAFMEARGIAMDHALARAAQPVYLPNVPDIHGKSSTPLRDEDGKALFYRISRTATDKPGLVLATGPVSEGIAAIRAKRAEDERERERIRREAEQRRANTPRGDGASLMDDFNAANSVAAMLELCGYQQSPRHGEDWRSPYQTSESHATRIIGSKWVSLSASDAAAGLGTRCQSGCYGDAYDLYVHFKHGGDHKAAYRTLGAERRADNVIYPRQFETPPVPDWMAETPGYDDYPDWGDPDGEPVIAPDLVETAREPGEEPALPFFWFSDAAPDLDANDFVEGMLTSGSMSVVYGPSNCGKTFFILDMALHVAWGRPWRGREVDQGAIVYLSLEGSQGIRNRLTAFRRHHELDNEQLPFVAMPKPINLLNDNADVVAVIELVRHVEWQTKQPVRMVIVDTLSRAMAGGNENSPEDMTALIGNVDRIRDTTGSHVCIVHHSGKDDAKGARGHSSLRAATDTEIEIKRDPELTFSSVRIAKQRDLEAADPFGFTLHCVPLGVNRRGKDVTSCVVLESDQAVIVGRDPGKLSAKEQQALDSLERCILTAGFDVELPRDMGVTQAVTLHAWKRSLQALGVIDRDIDNNARTQMRRIRNALEKKEKIEVEGDKVWLA